MWTVRLLLTETRPLRHRKVPSAAWLLIYMIDDINCFYKESAAALDWSGSECSRLPHMSMFRFFLLLSSLDPCLYLIFSTLLILILQHA